MLGLSVILSGCGPSGSEPGEDIAVNPNPALLELDLKQERSTAPVDAQVPGILTVLPAISEVRSMEFSPDGSLLAVGDDQGGVLWDLQTMTPLASLDDQPTPVSAVAFAPEGDALATAAYRFDPVAGVVTLWDTGTGAKSEELIAHPFPIVAMAYSSDGRTLVIGIQSDEGGGKVAFVDVETGAAEDSESTLVATAQRIATAPDGSLAAVGASTTINYQNVGELVLFDVSARSELSRPDLPIGLFYDQAFTPDGGSLVLAYQDKSERGVVQLIDPQTGSPQENLTGIPGEVVALAITADGATFALGDRDGRVMLLDRESGAVRRGPEFHRGQVRFLAFSPDGKTLASTGQDRRVALWEVEAMRQLDPVPSASSPVE